jgi:hypothetical protein
MDVHLVGAARVWGLDRELQAPSEAVEEVPSCQQVVRLTAAAGPVLADGLLQVCCCDVAREGAATARDAARIGAVGADTCVVARVACTGLCGTRSNVTRGVSIRACEVRQAGWLGFMPSVHDCTLMHPQQLDDLYFEKVALTSLVQRGLDSVLKLPS